MRRVNLHPPFLKVKGKIKGQSSKYQKAGKNEGSTRLTTCPKSRQVKAIPVNRHTKGNRKTLL